MKTKKSSIQQTWETFQQWYQRPAEDMSGWRRRVRHFLEFAYHCYRELIGNKATQMAAALTYYTLFSILPTLVLMLVVMHSFLGDAERNQFKQYVVNSVLEVMGEPSGQSPVETAVHGAGAAPDEMGASARESFDKARENLDEWVQGIFTQLESVSFRSIGVVGILVFIYAATSLLRSIESSFNAVYQTYSIKSIIVRLPVYYMVITLGPIVILAGQWAQALLFSWVESASWLAWLGAPLSMVAPLVTIWLVFFLAFVLLPNAWVKLHAAAVGSFVAALLWVVVISSFKFYVARYSYANLYGALALLPLFLFWLWVSWLIVLFGLEITYTLQHFEGKRLERENRRQRDRFVDPRYVLPVMAIVGEQFTHGRSVSQAELVHRTNLPTWAVAQIVRRLVQGGFLRETLTSGAPGSPGSDASPASHGSTTSGGGGEGVSLARPLEKIEVAQLLDTAAEATMTSRQLQGQPGMTAYAQIAQAARDAVGRRTLADLLSQAGDEDAP